MSSYWGSFLRTDFRASLSFSNCCSNPLKPCNSSSWSPDASLKQSIYCLTAGYAVTNILSGCCIVWYFLVCGTLSGIIVVPYAMSVIWTLLKSWICRVKAGLPTPNWMVWQAGQRSPDMRLAWSSLVFSFCFLVSYHAVPMWTSLRLSCMPMCFQELASYSGTR